MKNWYAILILSVGLWGGLGAKTGLTISLAHGTVAERQTRTQLLRLAARHDLAPWTFTRAIAIDDQATPHSHPVLTLHTRHLRDDELLLSTYVHEQFHWFLDQRAAATAQAIEELQGLFPALPVGFPEGAADAHSSYLHLLVIALEYRADRHLLGEWRARLVMEFWTTDHYTRLYRIVLENGRVLSAILNKHQLIPGLAPGPGQP